MKVLKFGAVWCSACLVMKPRWVEIETENPWLETKYYEYDDHQDKVAQYNIGKELPVFIFLNKQGEEFIRLTGEVDKSKILDVLEKNKDK